jgi:hypothetical protein
MGGLRLVHCINSGQRLSVLFKAFKVLMSMAASSCLSRREYVPSVVHSRIVELVVVDHNFDISTQPWPYSCVVLEMICCMIDVENICIVKGHGGFMIDHPGFAYVTTRTMAAISFLSPGMQTVIQMERMCSSCCWRRRRSTKALGPCHGYS